MGAPWKFLSSRLPRKYLASARDRVSINFRPIFNFNQDALLRHAKQPSPPISSSCPSPSPSLPPSFCAPRSPYHPRSLQVRKHLRKGWQGNFRGNSAVRSPRWVAGDEDSLSVLLPFVFRDETNVGERATCMGRLFIGGFFIAQFWIVLPVEDVETHR